MKLPEMICFQTFAGKNSLPIVQVFTFDMVGFLADNSFSTAFSPSQASAFQPTSLIVPGVKRATLKVAACEKGVNPAQVSNNIRLTVDAKDNQEPGESNL